MIDIKDSFFGSILPIFVSLVIRYEILCEFFNCMESSIRLLRLKGSMSTFSNISTSIQSLMDRCRFDLLGLPFCRSSWFDMKRV